MKQRSIFSRQNKGIYQKKCQIMNNRVSNENLLHFPNLEKFVTVHKIEIKRIISSNNIKFHCIILTETFEISKLWKYFKKYFEFLWLETLFILDIIPGILTSNKTKSLMELFCDWGLKMEFTKSELWEFWQKFKNKYPSLLRKPLFLILFSNTYLWETRFSAVGTVKVKFCNTGTWTKSPLIIRFS